MRCLPINDADRDSISRGIIFLLMISCLTMMGIVLFYHGRLILMNALKNADPVLARISETDAESARRIAERMLDLKKNPDNVEALTELGRLFFHGGDPARSEKFFSRAAELAPNDKTVLRGLAVAQMENGQSGAAAETLQKALRLKPDAETRYLLAVLYANSAPQKREEALRECEIILVDPDASDFLRTHAATLKKTLLDGEASFPKTQSSPANASRSVPSAKESKADTIIMPLK